MRIASYIIFDPENCTEGMKTIHALCSNMGSKVCTTTALGKKPLSEAVVKDEHKFTMGFEVLYDWTGDPSDASTLDIIMSSMDNVLLYRHEFLAEDNPKPDNTSMNSLGQNHYDYLFGYTDKLEFKRR